MLSQAGNKQLLIITWFPVGKQRTIELKIFFYPLHLLNLNPVQKGLDLNYGELKYTHIFQRNWEWGVKNSSNAIKLPNLYLLQMRG